MNMLCIELFPFNWDPTREYWYVAAKSADPQDASVFELDIKRPPGLFFMELRHVGEALEGIGAHCKNRRSNRPC